MPEGRNMTAIDTVNRSFIWAEMAIISSTYWNVIYGAKAEDAIKGTESERRNSLPKANK